MKNTIIIPILAVTAMNVAVGKDIIDAKVGKVAEAAVSADDAITYSFQKESKIDFTGSKVIGSHSGGFKSFTGEFKVEEGTPTSGSFTIDMTSIWSDDEKLTGHLKNEDFFNVPAFPESKLEVTGFKKNSETSYTVSGNLTMVGKTVNISFPAEVKEEGDTVTLDSEFNIDRQEWGVSYKGMKDNLIKDEVYLKLSLIAKKG